MKKEYAKKIAWENRFPKWYLRPYVDQAGSPFSVWYSSEAELLSVLHLSGALSEATSEYCARQGTALSEGAANCQVGAGVLQHHFAEGVDSGLRKTGLQALLTMLETPDGQKFLESCAYLNTGNQDVERSQPQTTAAVKRFLRFFTTDAAEKEAAFKKALRFAARLYLFAFEGLEALAALGNPKTMAAGAQQVGQQTALPQDCKDWLLAPEDPEALVWSLVAAFHHQRVEANRPQSAANYDWESEETGGWAAGGHAPWSCEDEEDEPPRKAAKGKGGARKGQAPKRRGDALASDTEPDATLDGLDLASSPEAAAEEAALDISEWPKEKIEALGALLAEVDSKNAKERPSLARFQAALREVPETALEARKLNKTRYPKTESLQKLVGPSKSWCLLCGSGCRRSRGVESLQFDAAAGRVKGQRRPGRGRPFDRATEKEASVSGSSPRRSLSLTSHPTVYKFESCSSHGQAPRCPASCRCCRCRRCCCCSVAQAPARPRQAGPSGRLARPRRGFGGLGRAASSRPASAA